MLSKRDKKLEKALLADKDRAERTRKKTAGFATNEASVAAELKNREHGNEQPAR